MNEIQWKIDRDGWNTQATPETTARGRRVLKRILIGYAIAALVIFAIMCT